MHAVTSGVSGLLTDTAMTPSGHVEPAVSPGLSREPTMAPGRCDVEISISMAGEETVEYIPECLQDAFMSGPAEGASAAGEPVVLPARYSRPGCSQEREAGLPSGQLVDRERDLGTALRWIRREMMLMKEQDKALMKQFISLRSGILQLRCLYELDSSNSDLSQDGSNFSLDERPVSPCTLTNGFLHNRDIELTEFRTRTTSLSVTPKGQRPKPVTRIKWKSHEYI